MADHTQGRITATRTALTPGQFGSTSTLNTFRINTSRLLLTSREQAEAKSLIARLRALQQKSFVRKAEEARGPFPFLCLPPELRIYCYAFVLGDQAVATTDLATLAMPNIARVSRSIRAEFLPWFFAHTPFTLTVAADLRNHAHLRAHPTALVPHLTVRSRCGVLKMRQQVKEVLWMMGRSNVLIRHLTLRVCDGERWRFLKGVALPDCQIVVEVALNVEKGKVRIDVLENPRFTSYRTWTGFDPKEEARRVAERAGLVAGGIAARGEGRCLFRGFELRDVESIAKVFRSGG